MALTANIRGQEKEVCGSETRRANLNTTRFPNPRDSSAPQTMAALTDNGRLVVTPFLATYPRFHD
jgi:hypothetical protein